ncbi:aspartate-semialdehyde dehydrogenase [Halobaculum sp. MBLA0147]|uniref:aspartate-semialdehyde dehydrogenase n=1 Tax=Halobaculum sp. MBLA0147 TaxID=3079934 RepID=UPI0035233966
MSLRVGVLGATGAVGQRFVQLIERTPRFEIETVTASPASAGQRYEAAAKWRLGTAIPEEVAELTVRETDPEALPDDLDLLFSSLPSDVAAEVEPALCEAGYVVSSNSSNERLAEDVPLTIPEVNPDHLGLIERQRDERGWDGALVKNPNCSTITMVPTLAALTEFGIESVQVSTLQAVSGAGYSGVTSMEIIDNAIPHIGGEEAKMETESRKLLGEFDGASVSRLDADVTASCNRIPTVDGHLENVFAELEADPTAAEVREAMRAVESAPLPSSPDQLIHVFGEDAPERPQPRMDRDRGDGMAVVAGGVTATDAGVKYNCLAHNTIRGAAGASLLNGELLADEGWI